MSNHVQLKADSRTMLGKKVRRLRAEGVIPATVYGQQTQPQSIQVDARDLAAVIRQAGRNQLIDLIIGEQDARPVFMKQTSVDAKRNALLHVEFFQANLRQRMITQAGLHFTGESPAVKAGGILLQVLDHVEIESLPEDVPPEGILIDISVIAEMNGQIHAHELQIPAGATLLTAGDEVVVKVNPPVSEEVLEEAIADTLPVPTELGGDQTPADAVPES